MPVGLLRDGDTKFDRGMDSMSDSTALPPGCYAWSWNMLNRGGVLKVRPGFDWRFTLPQGKLQGLTAFVPLLGRPVLIAFVSGFCYLAQYPYRSFTVVQGATMSAEADFVFFATATQTVTQNLDGSLMLIAPRQLLICQDGINPPTYFDGRVLTASMGLGAIPQGTHIAWVGARLWVARGNLVFASDLSNPLSFTEQTYNTLGGVQYFTLPDACTGFAALPGAPNVNTPLLAFTKSTTNMFQAAILNRTLWPTTPNFQTNIFPTIGCIAPRSIAPISGTLWWMSNVGLTRLDAAQSSALTTRIYRVDREMARSSDRMGGDLSGMAAVTYENLFLLSTPHADKRNTHTWLYDASVNDLASQNAVSYLTSAWTSVWSSVWTGVQPVQWATLTIDKEPRVFCASEDNDGNNRVYETFTRSTRDNGCDFPWGFESRAYTANTPLIKHFRFLLYSLSELQGEVNLRISWAGGSRGRWKVIDTPTFYAEEGSLDATVELDAAEAIFGLKKQSRIARTKDVRDMRPDNLSSSGIEGLVETIEADKEAVDTSFQFRVEGTGPCGVRSIVAFMDPLPAPDNGQANKPECPETKFVRFDGAAANNEAELQEAPESFSESATATAVWNNYVGAGEATIVGYISESDSKKRALQVAEARAEAQLASLAAPYIGGRLVSQS